MVICNDVDLDYFQDLRYLSEIEDLVRQSYMLRPEVWAAIAHRFHDLLALSRRTAVHVRRGDYIFHADLFPSLPPDCYMEAMALTRGP